MKNLTVIITVLFLALISCQKDPIISSETSECNLSFVDNSSMHPKKIQFENAIEKLEPLFPGLQVSVRSKDGNVWTGSQGFIDINNQINTTSCSRYLVGSVSKMFTSVLILKLQEENLLSINEDIKNILEPELINNIENANEVTIKNLLMHTSGIRDYLGVKYQIDRLNTSKLLLTPREKLEYIYDKSSNFEPNEKYDYSNTNYVLLGLIIEEVTGFTLEEAVELYISDSISLENTFQGTPSDPIPSGTARAYLEIAKGQFKDVMDFALSDAATGDGGIISNSQDLLYFIEKIVDTTLVSSTSYNLMLDNKVEIKEGKWYGLGLEQEYKDYGFRIAHTGGTEGYTSFLMNYPESNVTIAVCLNSSTSNEENSDRIIDFLGKLQDIAFE